MRITPSRWQYTGAPAITLTLDADEKPCADCAVPEFANPPTTKQRGPYRCDGCYAVWRAIPYRRRPVTSGMDMLARAVMHAADGSVAGWETDASNVGEGRIDYLARYVGWRTPTEDEIERSHTLMAQAIAAGMEALGYRVTLTLPQKVAA